MSDDLSCRSYRPSGYVCWPVFLQSAGVTLAMSVVMGVILDLLFDQGLHATVLIPLATSVPVMWRLRVAIDQGKCRHRGVAALLGLAAVAVLFLTSFQMDLVLQRDIAHVHRLDLLPAHIEHRLQSDLSDQQGAHWHKLRGERFPQAQPDPLSNGISLVIEVGVVSLAVLLVGMAAADRPFCEDSGRWMVEQSVALPAGSGQTAVAALSEGRLLTWVDQIAPVALTTPYCQVTIYVDPWTESQPSLLRAYLTITSGKGVGSLFS